MNRKDRHVIINPNPVKDTVQISIDGTFHLNTLKISVVRKNGLAVMEFIPRKIPVNIATGDFVPGRYYVRCIDKYGRIPSKKMTIQGITPLDPE